MRMFLSAVLIFVVLFYTPSINAEPIPEIHISPSEADIIRLYKEAGYWGKLDPDKILDVPPYLVVVASQIWDEQAAALPVEDKKELFYRSLLPLVLYSNKVIMADRNRLASITSKLADGRSEETDSAWLVDLAIQYRLLKPLEGGGLPGLPQGAELGELIDNLLLRVDIVPASLALGQGAYESGYGTSRFARKGNSLFGQWTYGGKGMQPLEKRASKGDYGVAAYDWPLDSVRSYMVNLNTHNAYSELRNKRAELRRSSQPVTGQALVGTLSKYSERGMEYVNTLSSIMRVNELDAADQASLRKGPVLLIVDAVDEADAKKLAAEIEELRDSGELARLIASMGVDFDH